jgi:hypothetical protein
VSYSCWSCCLPIFILYILQSDAIFERLGIDSSSNVATLEPYTHAHPAEAVKQEEGGAKDSVSVVFGEQERGGGETCTCSV